MSTATVSYVINDTRHVSPEKHKQVMDVINKTGYQPNIVAKSLRTKKTNFIGVLVEDVLSFAAPRIINGISEYMEKTDYHILLNDLRMMESLFNQYDQIIRHKDKIHNAIQLLVYGTKVDAIIYIGMFDRDISGILPNIGKPVVIAYSTSKDACFVTYDNEKIATQLTHHLINAGHRHIAVISGLAHTPPVLLRLKGIQKAFDEAGLTLDSKLIYNGDWERDSGYRCMKDLLKHSNPRPTAVFAMNDLMAIGAIDAILEAGLRVPQDISVVGFDNREVSEVVSPKLTTAEIDLKTIGYTAAQMVTERLTAAGQYVNQRKIIIPSKIVLRETVHLPMRIHC